MKLQKGMVINKQELKGQAEMSKQAKKGLGDMSRLSEIPEGWTHDSDYTISSLDISKPKPVCILEGQNSWIR